MLLKGEFDKDRFWIKCLIVAFLSVLGFVMSLTLVYILGFNNADLQSTRYTQFIFGLVGLALPALTFSYLINKQPNTYLHTNTFPNSRFIIASILTMILILPIINLMSSWNEQMHLPQAFSAIEDTLREMQKAADDLTLGLLEGSTIKILISNLFFLALVPAITEELFFRGALQRFLAEKMGPHLGIWVVAIVFSAFHMQFFGFFPRMFLGALLGYMLLWSNSLYLPIIAHFTNNASVVIVYFLSSRNLIALDIDGIGTHNQWWLALVSVICITPILFFMNKHFLSSKKGHTSLK